MKHTLGIIGGGQLGRMLLYSAYRLGISCGVLDPDAECASASICSGFVQGDFQDYETVLAFGRACETVTIEFENINTEALVTLKNEGVSVFPDPELIKMIQDKGAQKQFLQSFGFPTSKFIVVDNGEAALAQSAFLPGILKLRRAGYDGRGVMGVFPESISSTLFSSPCVLEERVDILKELSVIVVRNQSGDYRIFDPVEITVSDSLNLLESLIVDSALDGQLLVEIKKIAQEIAEATQLVGVMAIELFITKSGQLLINELSPRPHNSGHHTIEACWTSQYEQHLRAILGYPLGEVGLREGSAGLFNLVGPKDLDQCQHFWNFTSDIVSLPQVFLHHYGKGNVRPGRKMGHITVLGASPEEVRCRLASIKQRMDHHGY